MKTRFETGRRLFVTLVAGTVCAVAASAAPPADAPLSSKRQVSDCMSRRMANARTLSYNEASRLCKEEVKSHSETAVLRPSSKPVGAH